MLIVKDMSRLAEYGFKKQKGNSKTWTLEVASERDEDAPAYCDMSYMLIVNPAEYPAIEGHMIIDFYFYHRAEEDESLETECWAELDIIYEMIQDGVLEYRKNKKNKECAA